MGISSLTDNYDDISVLLFFEAFFVCEGVVLVRLLIKKFKKNTKK